MRDQSNVFHVAIPVIDLDEAQQFYVMKLGCKLARRYEDRITIDFFGDQLVCHLTDASEVDTEPSSLYPRHFGVTFRHESDFEALHDLAELRKIPFFRTMAARFDGLPEVHRTFVLIDPSGNLVEFKHYRDHRMMY